MKGRICQSESKCDRLVNGCFCVLNIGAQCLSEQPSSLRWCWKGPFVPFECKKKKGFLTVRFLCALFVYWQARRILWQYYNSPERKNLQYSQRDFLRPPDSGLNIVREKKLLIDYRKLSRTLKEEHKYIKLSSQVWFEQPKIDTYLSWNKR